MAEDLGSVTLLELNEAPDSKHLAYCLPTGEFICATAASAHCFANDASDAHGLYGRNLCQFLAPHDIERLEDYMRGHCARSSRTFDTTANSSSNSGLQMMVRIERTGVPVWVRLQTIALTLRMLRCIDAVQSMCAAAHWFADASSFVVSDEDFGTALTTTTATAPARHHSTVTADASRYDDPFFFASPASSLESESYSKVQPLAHNSLLRTTTTTTTTTTSAATTPKGGRTSSTASTDVADDEEFAGVDDAESLAGYAFEADWASEVAHEASPARTSVDWT